jgi:hypothetical protein
MIATASALEAGFACPASLMLPRVGSTNPDAADGTVRHAFVADLLEHPEQRDDNLESVPKRLRSQCAAIRVEDVLGGIMREDRMVETAFALHVDTLELRWLGAKIARRYPDLGPRWVCGTLDLAGQLLDDSWIVRDLKTGFQDVTDAKENPQLLFFTLILSILHPEAPAIRGAIVRLSADGAAHMESSAEYSRFELDAFAVRLRELGDKVAKMKRRKHLDVVEGSWCRYCQAFASCPAKQQLVRRLAPELDEVRAKIATLTIEDAGRAWSVLRRLLPIAEACKDALKERAAVEPIPFQDGEGGETKWLRPVRYDRTGFDSAAAVVLLRELGATEEQLAALRPVKGVEQIRECKGSR